MSHTISVRQVFPVVMIEGYAYKLGSFATWEFNYSVDGRCYRCESSCPLSTSAHWRYLGDSEALNADTLGRLLAAS